VSERSFGGSWTIGSLDELLVASLANAPVLEARPVLAKNFPHLATLFALPQTRKLFRIVKLLTTDGTPYAVVHLFTSVTYASRIPRKLLSKDRLIHLIEQFNGVSSAHIKQVASAVAADAKIAPQLKMRIGDPVLVLRRTHTSSDRKPIMHLEMFCRPSHYQQTVNFSRQSNG